MRENSGIIKPGNVHFLKIILEKKTKCFFNKWPLMNTNINNVSRWSCLEIFSETRSLCGIARGILMSYLALSDSLGFQKFSVVLLLLRSYFYNKSSPLFNWRKHKPSDRKCKVNISLPSFQHALFLEMSFVWLTGYLYVNGLTSSAYVKRRGEIKYLE